MAAKSLSDRGECYLEKRNHRADRVSGYEVEARTADSRRRFAPEMYPAHPGARPKHPPIGVARQFRYRKEECEYPLSPIIRRGKYGKWTEVDGDEREAFPAAQGPRP